MTTNKPRMGKKAVKLAETIHLILLRALMIVVIRVRSQVKMAEMIPKRIS